MDVPPAKKPKLLLVEDEANIASMVVDWLAERYDVVVASTGKDALLKAPAERPDLILEDINLPDMSGFDVVKFLEKDSRVNQIPVIFLTGEKMVEETIKFISTVKNVKGYINKPFRLKDFMEKIDLILGHKADFVVLDRRPSSTETQGKAEAVREARAQDRDEPAAKKKKLPVPGDPSRPITSEDRKKRSFFRVLFSASFSLILWSSWGLLAAGAAGELLLRSAERFLGEPFAFPPLAPAASGAPVAVLPGASWAQGGVSYLIDGRGLRDDVPADLSTSTFRVFVLGGRPIFGEDVPLARTVSKRLEVLWNQDPALGAAARCRVIHGALWGKSPTEQWEAYEGFHGDFKPGLVVWMYGDPGARALSVERLEEINACPPQARFLLEESRLVDFLATLYVYGDPAPAPSIGGALADRVNAFLAANPGTALVVFRMKGDDAALHGLAGRPNLMVFDVNPWGASDLSWKGLTLSGHEALARMAYAAVLHRKDRILPPAAAPAPAPALKKVPSKTRRAKR